MSRAIASSILRKFSACCSSRVEYGSLPSLVTPSTRNAISLPNCFAELLDRRARVLDTSCSSAAQMLATSSFSCAMISATRAGG